MNFNILISSGWTINSYEVLIHMFNSIRFIRMCRMFKLCTFSIIHISYNVQAYVTSWETNIYCMKIIHVFTTWQTWRAKYFRNSFSACEFARGGSKDTNIRMKQACAREKKRKNNKKKRWSFIIRWGEVNILTYFIK